MRSTLTAIVFVLAGFLVAPGIASAQAAGDYVIGPQDVLNITVFDQADLGGKYAVELDGTFTFPLIGRIQAGGLTIRDFETELKKQLSNGFFKNPQVTVSIEQYRSQRVFVTGEVRSPGAYPLTGDMTLIEALAKAGSTTPSAADQLIVVHATKPGEPAAVEASGPADNADDRVRINLKDLQSGASSALNIELRDGDTIYVPKAELIYVFGEVKSPGSYSITSDTTVLQALSLAGGVTPNGAINRVKVTRLVDGEQQDIRVKVSDQVQPGDTITVPERYF